MLAPYSYLGSTEEVNGNKEINLNNENDEMGIIKEGSHVILMSNRDNVQSLFLKKDCIFDNRYGHFHHNDIIGLNYGSRVFL